MDYVLIISPLIVGAALIVAINVRSHVKRLKLQIKLAQSKAQLLSYAAKS